jgi:Ni,Fe-hydrogenase III small subunit
MSKLGFLDNIFHKVNLKNNEWKAPVRVFGNGAAVAIEQNFEYLEYVSSFNGFSESTGQPAETFLIIGPINKTQLEKVKIELENAEVKPVVVFVRGPLPRNILNLSSEIVSNVSSVIQVDLEYFKYPVDLKELITIVNSQIIGRHGNL